MKDKQEGEHVHTHAWADRNSVITHTRRERKSKDMTIAGLDLHFADAADDPGTHDGSAGRGTSRASQRGAAFAYMHAHAHAHAQT